MKNRSEPHWTSMEYDKSKLVLLKGTPGYSGYYVDRFNDVYSVRKRRTPMALWESKFPSGAVVQRLTLFDDDGKRRQPSRRKVLKDTLGVEEFERRELARKSKDKTLEKEAEEYRLYIEKLRAKEHEELMEMHKDDYTQPSPPLHMLDPAVADLIRKARKNRMQKALGELF